MALEKTYNVRPESLDLGILLVGAAKVAEVCHGDWWDWWDWWYVAKKCGCAGRGRVLGRRVLSKVRAGVSISMGMHCYGGRERRRCCGGMVQECEGRHG